MLREEANGRYDRESASDRAIGAADGAALLAPAADCF